MQEEAPQYLSGLLRQIDQSFSLEDVQTLSLELGIDYENLPGKTREGLIRELIKQLVRGNRLPELVALAGRKRPALTWEAVPVGLIFFPDDPFAEAPIKRLDFEPETARIPAGSFLMGSDRDNPEEAPCHTAELPAFAIGIYPVTNEQYGRFIRDSRRVAGPNVLWAGNLPPPDRLTHPVTGVTWYEALDYCRWLSQATGRAYSLPTEAQWEKAARGTDGRVFPWGNDWLPDRCNTSPDNWTAVDAYPAQSIYGCFDMAGNAREWTLTGWGRDPRTPDRLFAYPWRDDRRNDPGEPSTTRRVFRGGRAAEPNDYRCSARGGFLPDKPGPSSNRHGFRVALKLG